MFWRSYHMAIPKIPDGRQAHLLITADQRGTLVTFLFEEGLIHPDLLVVFNQLSVAISESDLYDFDPEHRGKPLLSAWLERVPAELMPPGEIMHPRAGVSAGLPPFIEIMCLEDLVAPGVVREMNESLLPKVCGMFAPGAVMRQAYSA